MHELTLAMTIVDMVVEEAERSNAGTVQEIELEVGVLSGVNADALEFALSLAMRNTVLENAFVLIVQTKGSGRCNQCDRVFAMTEIWTTCPGCNMPAGEILSGDAMRIVSLVVNDQEEIDSFALK
ncbi:MAG: hydrogenase maturation nickel metallochaperone HypA [Bacteroidales bacterium]|jgi:hydrogenase nickel incorporation protein HypA/HybF|nr:hydrogenase maturation nickel metallochaperone HypA [Bacteroidales bacterium]